MYRISATLRSQLPTRAIAAPASLAITGFALLVAGCYIQPAPAEPAYQPAPVAAQPGVNPVAESEQVPVAAAPGEGGMVATSEADAQVTGVVGDPYVEIAARPASSTYQLRYDWRAGDIQRFRYAEKARIRVTMNGSAGMGVEMGGMDGGMMGGGMMGGVDMHVGVNSEFALRIDRVERDGWAQASLELQAFALSSGGRTYVDLAAIPAQGRVVRAWISPRGEIVFANDVLVVMADTGMQVVLGQTVHRDRAKASARASVRVGNQSYTVAASVNAETGTVTAGAQLSARARTTTLRHEDTTLDVFPRELLRMIVLPEDALTVDGQVAVKTPLGDSTVTVRELGDGRLSYHATVRGGIAGLEDLAGTMSTVITPDGDAARLTSASGNFSMSMDVGGMRQSVQHVFSLAALP